MSADAVPNAAEQIPDAAHPAGAGVIKPGYAPRLTNEDLAPLESRRGPRTTSSRSGCPMCTASAATSPRAACSRWAWPAGRCWSRCWSASRSCYFLCNLVARPRQATGTPYPVVCRISFGVLGRQHPGHHPRPDRGGLVRHPDLPASVALVLLSSSSGPGWRRTPSSAARVRRAVAAGLDRLRHHVGRPGDRVLARHGVDPQVHRLLRAPRCTS